MKRERNLSPDAKIRLGESFSYGLGGAFGAGAVNIFIASFILIFYTEVLHVNPAIASGVIGFSKLLDGLSDLVAGKIIDNTNHKMGKARIWILRMIPFTIASLFAIYLMPMNMSTPLQVVYIFITYNLSSTVCYTMSYVAYMSLNGLMTTDQKSRGTNAGVQMIGNVLIGLIGNSTIITLLTNLSKDPSYSAYGDRHGWLMLLAIYMVVYVICELILVFGTRERVEENIANAEEENEEKVSKIPFLITMKALFTNKFWVINIIVGFVINLLMGLESTVGSLICTYVLGDVSFYQVTSSVNSICMLVAMLSGFVFMRILGKRNSVIVGMCIRLLGGVVMAINISKTTILIGGAMAGIGYGIAGCAFASMIQDALTYGEWKNGFSMIGMGNAANSFCGKVGNSFGTVAMGVIMSMTGYVAGLAVQPDSAIAGFKAIYIYIPLILELFAVAAMLFYNLDKIYPRVEADLKEGKYYNGQTENK